MLNLENSQHDLQIVQIDQLHTATIYWPASDGKTN